MQARTSKPRASKMVKHLQQASAQGRSLRPEMVEAAVLQLMARRVRLRLRCDSSRALSASDCLGLCLLACFTNLRLCLLFFLPSRCLCVSTARA